MRGKGYVATRQVKESRITPAHAGKSRTVVYSTHGKKDHPRTCGEKVTTSQQMLESEGSHAGKRIVDKFG